MDDPDVQLALEAVGRGSLDPEAHYMVAEQPETPSRAPVFRTSFGVSILTYPEGAHAEMDNDLTELANRVIGARQEQVPAR